MSRRKDKIIIPPGYKPWGGEPSMSEYLATYYARRQGESDVEWIGRYLPRCKDEPDVKYLLRIAEDPVLVTMLTQWAPFPCKIKHPRLGHDSRLKADVVNLNAMLEFFDVFGKVMKAKIDSLKAMGWLLDQRYEADGRYGIGFIIKNILHAFFQACGINSNMTIYMPGESFYHTNTVVPKQEWRGSLTGIYNPGLRGPWTGMISNRRHKFGFMAIGENQLCMESLNANTTTDAQVRRNRWEYYQFILHAYFDTAGVLSIRGFLGSQEYMQQATLREIDVLVDERTESEESVNVDGRERKVNFKGKMSRSKKIPMYVLPIGKLRPTIDLLRALSGFDESKLEPARISEKD